MQSNDDFLSAVDTVQDVRGARHGLQVVFGRAPHRAPVREVADSRGRAADAATDQKRRIESKLRKTAGAHYVLAGGEAVWTFRWELPESIGQGCELSLTDLLDSRLALAFREGAPCVGLRYSDRTGAIHTLDASCYTVTYNRCRREVGVSLRGEAVFARLAQAALRPGSATPCLHLELVTDVRREAAGIIHNTGVLSYIDRAGGVVCAVPLEDPFVEVIGFGAICIYKCDIGTGMPLAGARFEVYGSREEARARKNPLANPNVADGAWPPTGEDGYTQISGLLFTGYGAEYWLVETRVPTVPGKAYMALSDAVRVWVDAQSHLPKHRVTVFSCAWEDRSPGRAEDACAGK